MANHFIGIGATGAKILEAMTYLIASGVVDSDQNFMYFIDSDHENGNWRICNNIVSLYGKIRDYREYTQVLPKSLFLNKITSVAPTRQNNFNVVGSEKSSLWDVLGESLDNNASLRYQNLTKILYDPSQLEKLTKKKALFSKGFVGSASIGSAVISISIEKDNFGPLIRKKIQQEDNIIILGSLFGGMGASGIPTILNYLHKEKIHPNNIALVLALPYFKLNSEGITDKFVDSGEFNNKTSIALEFYARENLIEKCKAVYMIGLRDNEQEILANYSLGGEDQISRRHFVELLLGLTAARFCSPDGQKDSGFLTVRNSGDYGANLINAIIPGASKKLNRLLNFSLSFRYLHEKIKSIYTSNSDLKVLSAKHPWFPYVFQFKNLEKSDQYLHFSDNMLAFSEKYLHWLRHLHSSPQLNLCQDLKAICNSYPIILKKDQSNPLNYEDTEWLVSFEEKFASKYLSSLENDIFAVRHNVSDAHPIAFLNQEIENKEYLHFSLSPSSGSFYGLYPTLNRTSDDNPIQEPLETGVVLQKSPVHFSRRLYKDKADGSAHYPDAIASVWARAIYFQQALLSTGHPQHENILSEWYGLLAFYSLAYQYNLDKENLNFHGISDQSKAPFINSLYHYAPEPAEFWRNSSDMYLIRKNNLSAPFAFSSPAIVLFSPANYNYLPDGIIEGFNDCPWFNPRTKVFESPFQGDRLSRVQRNALHKDWTIILEELESNLMKIQIQLHTEDVPGSTTTIKLLNNFLYLL